MESDGVVQESETVDDFKPIIVESTGGLKTFSQEWMGHSSQKKIYHCGHCEKTFAQFYNCIRHEINHKKVDDKIPQKPIT